MYKYILIILLSFSHILADNNNTVVEKNFIKTVKEINSSSDIEDKRINVFEFYSSNKIHIMMEIDYRTTGEYWRDRLYEFNLFVR